MQISHEAIYRNIYADNEMAETRTNICAARNRAARVMQVGKNDVAPRSRTVSALTSDLEIVAEKTRIDDWEGDTMIGKNHKGGLVTLAERKSRSPPDRGFLRHKSASQGFFG